MTGRLSPLTARLWSPALALAVGLGWGAAAPTLAADDAWRDATLAAVLEEPSVVEAMFPNSSGASFWASMRDDGTRRDGFAE